MNKNVAARMSESFQSALGKVDYGKYIDQIQAELRRAVSDIGPGKTPQEIEAIQGRLQSLLAQQTKQLAKEVGFLGNQAMVFMIATSIVTTAWVSFTLRRETTDLAKSPEDRLATIEVLDSLNSALGNVIQAASAYADQYPGDTVAKAASEEPEEKS